MIFFYCFSLLTCKLVFGFLFLIFIQTFQNTWEICLFSFHIFSMLSYDSRILYGNCYVYIPCFELTEQLNCIHHIVLEYTE